MELNVIHESISPYIVGRGRGRKFDFIVVSFGVVLPSFTM